MSSSLRSLSSDEMELLLAALDIDAGVASVIWDEGHRILHAHKSVPGAVRSGHMYFATEDQVARISAKGVEP